MTTSTIFVRTALVWTVISIAGYSQAQLIEYCSDEPYRDQYTVDPPLTNQKSEWFGYRVGLTSQNAIIGRNIDDVLVDDFNVSVYTSPTIGLSYLGEVDPYPDPSEYFYALSPDYVMLNTTDERFLVYHYAGLHLQKMLIVDWDNISPDYAFINRPPGLQDYAGTVYIGSDGPTYRELAIDGQNVIIGANKYEAPVSDYVVLFYHYDGLSWTLSDTVRDSADLIGKIVDVEGEVAAISKAGSILIYRDSNGDGSWDHDYTISVAYSDFDFNTQDELFVLVNNRLIRIYEYDDVAMTWSETDTLDPGLDLEESYSYKADSDWMVIGHNNSGTSKNFEELDVYRRSSSGWSYCYSACFYGSNQGIGFPGAPALDLRNGFAIMGDPGYHVYDFFGQGGVGPDGVVVTFDLSLLVQEKALATYELGDMNCDGRVDPSDINPFIRALNDRPSYESDYPCCSYLLGDLNCDGNLSAADISPFTHAINNGGGATCP